MQGFIKGLEFALAVPQTILSDTEQPEEVEEQ